MSDPPVEETTSNIVTLMTVCWVRWQSELERELEASKMRIKTLEETQPVIDVEQVPIILEARPKNSRHTCS
jgi:hypothetical protein